VTALVKIKVLSTRRKDELLRPISSERRHFCRLSLNVRPMAIASPTLFICVVSVGSACRNF
jgi:hypothetical protein